MRTPSQEGILGFYSGFCNKMKNRRHCEQTTVIEMLSGGALCGRGIDAIRRKLRLWFVAG